MQLLDFNDVDRRELGTRPLVSRHRLHELEIFAEPYLADLLDRHPRDKVQAFTMGDDPCNRDEWAAADPGGLSGRELMSAVRNGRLWLNVLRTDLSDPSFKDLLRSLCAELKAECPHLGLVDVNFGTLLISSPRAMVYYHLDLVHQALWHIRGTKRVWAYPACDDRFTPQDDLEDLFAGSYGYDEELPYARDFDAHAEVLDLLPGDVATWPLNAPHRVQNLDTVNVSFVTGFVTEEAERRSLVYNANRLLRTTLGVRRRSTDLGGWRADAKCLAYRAIRRFHGAPRRIPSAERPRLRVHPSLGVVPQDLPVAPKATERVRLA